MNNFGEIGDGTTTNRSTPVQVSGVRNVVDVDGGHDHSLAVLADGTVWAWGTVDYGGLGDGSALSSATPLVITY